MEIALGLICRNKIQWGLICALYTTPQIGSKRNWEILKFNINQKFQIQGVRDIEARVFLPNPESSSHSNCPPYNIYVQMLKEQNVKLCFSHCWLWSRSKVGKKLGTMQDECQREFIYLHTLFHRKSASRRRFRSFFATQRSEVGHSILFSGKFCFDTVITLSGKHKSLGLGPRNPEKEFYPPAWY